MSDYPILVERFDYFHSTTAVVCEECGHERDATGDEIVEGEIRCERLSHGGKPCGGWMEFKYAEADHKCGGCGALGFFPDSLGNNCSRVCQLQAEYAATLKEQAA